MEQKKGKNRLSVRKKKGHNPKRRRGRRPFNKPLERLQSCGPIRKKGGIYLTEERSLDLFNPLKKGAKTFIP